MHRHWTDGVLGGPGGTTSAILIIDADLGRAAALAVALRDGYRVEIASNTPEALHRLATSPPSVVILDAEILQVDGAWLGSAIRARRPGCRLIVRASITWPAGEAVDAFSVDGLLSGPLDLDQLHRHLRPLVKPEGAGAQDPRRISEHVSRAVEYVSRHSAASATVADVAAAVGISPSRLAHLFVAEIGTPVREYVTRVRLEVAGQLLIDTRDKLATVAERVGFHDAPHLSRLFRRRVGRWPGEYRRSRGSGAER